jgi:multidrug transporter EmrE-like cation transporter
MDYLIYYPGMFNYALIIFSISFGLIGDIFLKRYGYSNLIIGMVLWTAGAIPTSYVLKRIDFSVLGIIWSCFSIILTMIMGTFIYHEAVTSMKILALFFALLAVILAGK